MQASCIGVLGSSDGSFIVCDERTHCRCLSLTPNSTHNVPTRTYISV